MKIIRKNNAILAIVIVLMLSVFSMIPQMAIANVECDAGAQSGNGVQPICDEGNPTCSDINHCGGYSTKIETVASGTYPLQGVTGHSVTIEVSGDYFNWTSTLGICAVIVKGGTGGANIYQYDPLLYSDTDLHTPINPSGGPAGISHITFCYSEPEPKCPTCSIASVEAVCEDDGVFSLDATIDPGDYTSYNLSWSDNTVAGGTFSDASIEDPTWTPPADFTGTATLTLTVTADGCEESKCTVDVTVYPNPACSIAPVEPICAGEFVQLDTTVTGGTSPYEYSWSSDSGGTFSNSTIEDPTWTSPTNFTGIATLTLTVTDSKGCTTTCFVDVTVDPCEEPECPTCSIAPVEAVCEDGVEFTLHATVTGGTSPYEYAWSSDSGGTFSDSTIEDPTWTPPTDFTGTATLTLTVTDDGCDPTICKVEVTVYPKPLCIIASVDPICAGESVQLYAAVNGGTPGYIYSWDDGVVGGTFNNSSIEDPIWNSPSGFTGIATLTLTVTDSKGCTTTCSVKVTVDPCEKKPCKCSLVVEKRDEAGNIIEDAVFEVDGIKKTTSGGEARWDDLECGTTYEVRELSPIEQTEGIHLGDCGERSTMRVVNKIEVGELEVLGIMEVLPFTGPAIPYSPFIGISTVLAGTFLYILSKPKKKR